MAKLVLEQHVPATPDSVYAAWTSADGLARWWWPHIPDTTYEVDARAGGSYEIRSRAAGIGVRGEYLDLDEPRLIRMTWNWLDDGVGEVEEQVRVAFVPKGNGTVVTLNHELSSQSGAGDDLRQGWHDVLARLAETADR